MEKHTPVLLAESIKYLNLQPNGIYVDCTLGRGGHSSEILKHLDNGVLYAIDQDPTAIAESQTKLAATLKNFHILNGNFSNIASLLALKNVFQVDGILYDLGVSSPQFDVGERGFSYRFDGPLDMRMDTVHNQLTAEKVINQKSEEELCQIFWQYGDEKFARQIASSIIKTRPLKTTFELVDVIKQSLPQKVLKQKGHPAKKVFQALRIYVNDEINVLKTSIEQSLKLLKSKGRIVIITFHSLEEKIVKESFKAATISGMESVISKLPIEVKNDTQFSLIIKKPIVPKNTEIENNNRAHSSKMWVIEKK
ncbi:16S rRNA (cytosine(1402)-N(4))-methyltransferase RsmH [Williamsoniiplasma luminosum]|uniref:Ribosomal RNA small subunit methyltransferase H n=1 Tax=Williamsoniiplasma luminosum TaxID=214888 RepID=A0A2S0NJ30_9MOLU|nr:16S rRNA (cytosine(1402)-N(4))-methyltransferase RsmH [Williamsoniiplasma luminosum]AVP49019.1 MAG: 16S rRNA (cytosine(1402)-N(4))-methyltransferase [Williamsoniiplasma luminosum]